MKKTNPWHVSILSCLFALSSGLTLAQTDRHEEATEDLRRLKEEIEINSSKMLAERTKPCLSSFGSERFCACIAKEIPFGYDFTAYIALTMNPKDEIGYHSADEKLQRIYDRMIVSRNKCVKEGF